MATAVHAQSADAADDHGKAAAASHRKAERERIHSERAEVVAQRQKDEAVCYQRFSVEDCLRGVRAQVRDAESRLRSRELELNDAERKEKAAERLRSIEEKQKPIPPSALTGATPPGTALRHAPGADPKVTKAQREHEADVRAQDQRNKLQTHAQAQSARSADNADRAAKARARQAEVIKAAQERRERVEKAQADAAASGRQPAAPLPMGSSAQ